MSDPNADPLDVSPIWTRALHDAITPLQPGPARRGVLVDAAGDVTTGALAEEVGRLRRHQIAALAYADAARREAIAAHDAESAASASIADRLDSVEKQLRELRELQRRIADALGIIPQLDRTEISESLKKKLGG